MLSRTSPRRSSRRPSIATPLCEPLEPRLALTAIVVNDILIIVGSPTADTIGIAPGSGNGTAVLSGVPGVPNGTEFINLRGLRVDLKSGNDTFSLTGNILTPDGQPASLLVLGGNGQDTISLAMSVGLPEIRGGNSHDTLSGGPANDLLKGGRGMDNLFGNAGEDRLEGQLGRDSLFGGPANDSLFGGNQADQLWGNDGNDLLNGGLHRDVLWGGLGLDTLLGGAAADRFNGTPGEAQDFGPADDNFNALFNPDLPGVLPGQTFWNRLAAGEDPLTGRLDVAAVNASNILVDAFAASTVQLRAARTAINGLSIGAREGFLADLLTITNDYSPSVLNNPAAFTPTIFRGFGDDLIAAAPATNNLPQTWAEFINQINEECSQRSYDQAVNDLAPVSNSAQAHLFAADSLFNTIDWN